MSDIVIERPWENGREFELTLREIRDVDRTRWIADVKVVGKEHQSGSSESFSGLSQGHVRDQAHRWMLAYKS